MMLHENSKGLARAVDIYRDRTLRVRELKEAGRKIVGYKSILPVLEMLTAIDVVPFRLFGDIRETIMDADSVMSTVVCPMIRSVLDLGLKGRYDFLDGSVMAHCCDGGQNLASIWRTCMNDKHTYHYFLDYPHGIRPSEQKETREMLLKFKESLESHFDTTLSDENLRRAIDLHNRQRGLVRALYDLRKPDPPLLSGVETMQVVVALMSLPVEEGIVLLEEVIDEVETRQNTLVKKPRLLIWGSTLDDITMIDMIEEAGANVVMDDMPVGSRFYWPDVKPADDLFDALAYRYLVELKSPRTYRDVDHNQTKKDYWADLDVRFGHLAEFANDWHVQGVILESVRYCDIHGYEVPALTDYFARMGLQSIYLEHTYSQAELAPLNTRVQAFLELIGI